MSQRCVVSFTDLSGIHHRVEVEGDSLYTAAAAGLEALKADTFTEHLGPATRLQIDVPGPTVTHILSVQRLLKWANADARSPNERARKTRVLKLLAK